MNMAQNVSRSQSSFSSCPPLHVYHTWVLEWSALMACGSTPLSSRRFGAPSDQDDDVTWTIDLYVSSKSTTQDATSGLEVPATGLVYVTVHSRESKRSVLFRARLSVQKEAVGAKLDDAKQKLVEYAKLEGMLPGTNSEGYHVGSIALEASNPTLTLRVDIVYFPLMKDAEPGPSVPVPPCSLAADMEDLLQNGQLADAVLVDDDGREWPIHKAVLSARSPVFAAMFAHDMSESKSNRVELKDISGEVLQQALRFVYTGRVDYTCSLGIGLLAVAERYTLPRLKALCERELARSVAEDNAVQVLVNADLYNADALRDVALQYVSSNIHCVLDSAAWKELVVARPHLLQQVLTRCANRVRL